MCLSQKDPQTDSEVGLQKLKSSRALIHIHRIANPINQFDPFWQRGMQGCICYEFFSSSVPWAGCKKVTPELSKAGIGWIRAGEKVGRLATWRDGWGPFL